MKVLGFCSSNLVEETVNDIGIGCMLTPARVGIWAAFSRHRARTVTPSKDLIQQLNNGR